MSLNRYERTLFDYWQSHPDELRHWQARVRRLDPTPADAARLAEELWDYWSERSRVAEPFRGLAAREGTAKVSLRNLAEHLLRLWGPAVPARRPGPSVT